MSVNPNSKENVKKIIKLTTKDFFKKWDEMFARLVEYKEKHGRTTVNKNCKDREFYTWFRHLKRVVLSPDVQLPDYYYNKLKSIDFYFGDGHKERERLIALKWVELLKEALEAGEKVQSNHRYKYKGKHLGTFLVNVTLKNKEGQWLDIREKIEELGFDFDKTARTPESVVKRFLSDLLADENPVKFLYQTRFNQYVMPKKDKIKPHIIKAINDLWQYKFNEERKWEIEDFVIRWKRIRYSEEKNPEGKWLISKKQMGRVYDYAMRRKLYPETMEKIIDRFTDKEKEELKKEGFKVDFD